jgi:hypothetical protein
MKGSAGLAKVSLYVLLRSDCLYLGMAVSLALSVFYHSSCSGRLAYRMSSSDRGMFPGARPGGAKE